MWWKRPNPALILAGILCLPFLAFSFPNEPDGFRGIAWGSDLATLGAMEHVRDSTEDPGFVVYLRRPDDLSFAGAALKAVEYEFWKDRLARVTLKTGDLYNFILLRDAIMARHGRGEEPEPRAERYYWKGETTTMSLISRFDIS